MNAQSAFKFIASGLLAVSSSVAGDFDGITLLVNKGPAPGAVRLDWTGGSPVFDVFRFDHPSGVASPGHRVGLTSDRNWPDTPPPGTIYFYKVEVCSSGAETCNGFDDNCDGVADDGNPGGGIVCSTGLQGVCAAGTTACANGGITCAQNLQASPETCNGLDDNCDGAVDDGNPGGGASCDGVDSDLCAEGTTSCSGGSLVCSDNTGSTLDVCDGVDNDCDPASADGAEDAQTGLVCDGADSDLCAEGTKACVGGTEVCSDNTGSTLDVCDGVDNDCDPASADGAEDAQTGVVCDGPDSDLCNEGTKACVSGTEVCSDNTGSTLDVCDGVDNDCDAASADGAEDAQTGVVCDGPDSDLCNEGTKACVGGTEVCSDNTGSTLDVCDGVDNDCDPASADGAEDAQTGILCDGPDSDLCAEGTNGCVGGTEVCSDLTGSTVEVCNGLDDDCEGTVDMLWSATLPSGDPASPPVNDTGFNPGGGSATYVAQGTKLYAFKSSTGAPLWTTTFPTTIANFPNPVPLSAGGGTTESIFLAGTDGFIYKVNAIDGVIQLSVNTGRPGHPTDSIAATPAVQLYSASNAAFRSDVDGSGHTQDDIVFVITRIPDNADATRNRVIAYFASDLTVKWTFNANGGRRVDYGSDGCAIDYSLNTLFCGTNLVALAAENSLFAISSLNGALSWAGNAGSVQNRPMLAGNKLYVATKSGSIMKYDRNGNGSGGALQLWTTPVAVPNVVRNVWPEFRGGTFQDKILALDATGTLWAVVDNGTTGAVAWSNPTSFASMPALHPTIGKAYVGQNNGNVRQLDLYNGQSDAAVQAGTSTVFDPALDIEGGGLDVNRVTVAARDASGTTSTVRRFCVPFGAATPGLACVSDGDCASKTTACTVGRCDPASHVCWGQPLADGTLCSDAQSCTLNEVCKSGSCLGQLNTSCPCNAIGDKACAPGTTCCGPAAGCRDLQTDSLNCGACGSACGEDEVCATGICKTDPNQCSAGLTSAATLSTAAPGILGADALAYERTAGHLCGAYVSTYRSAATAKVARIDPTGSVLNSTYSLDFSPLHGVAVPRQGDQMFAAFINNGVSFTPALGVAKPALPLAKAITAFTTTGSGPFTEPRFNYGPVGPAFDYVTYNGSDNSRATWLGNWHANGDVYALKFIGGAWTASPEPLWTPSPNRITAIAFERRLNRQLALPLKQRHLFVGHGTTLSIVNLDTAQRSDLNLADPAVYGGVNAIMSIAVHPVYGDIYVEVKDGSGSSYILDVSGHDNSVRHHLDVQTDLKAFPPVPFTFSNQGRLAVPAGLKLLRIVPGVDATPTFTEWGVPQ